MTRRTFIAGMTSLLVATAAGRGRRSSQGKSTVSLSLPRHLLPGKKTPLTQVWLGELRRMGFVEGQNLVVERYSPEGQTEDFAELENICSV